METKTMISFRKTRDFGEKINATFEFTGKHWKKLGKCLVYMVGPIALLSGFFYGLYSTAMLNVASGDFGGFSGFFINIGGMILCFFLAAVMVNTVVYEYISLYVEKGNDFDMNDVWAATKRDYLMIAGTMFLYGIIVTLGCLLLILPGIYFAIALSFLFIIRIKERLSFSEAFSRCFNIITDKWWSSFGLYFIMSMIVGALLLIFSIPSSVITFIVTFNRASGETQTIGTGMEIISILSNTIYLFASFMFQSIVIIAMAFQYFNLVERKESVGLMEKIQTLGSGEQKRDDEVY